MFGSLPTIPDIIELKSPDGERTGSDMWVKNALYSLTRASQSEVTSPTGWPATTHTVANLCIYRFNLASLSRASMSGTITGVLSPLLVVRLVRSMCMTWCELPLAGLVCQLFSTRGVSCREPALCLYDSPPVV